MGCLPGKTIRGKSRLRLYPWFQSIFGIEPAPDPGNAGVGSEGKINRRNKLHHIMDSPFSMENEELQ